MSTRALVILTCGLVIWLVMPQPLRAEEPLKQMLMDWKSKSDKYQSVRYTLLEVEQPKEGMPTPKYLKTPAVPAKTTERKVRTHLTVEFTTGRFRHEQSELATNGSKGPQPDSLLVYDGKAIKTWNRRTPEKYTGKQPNLIIGTGNLRHVTVEAVYWPVFEAHGVIPTANYPLRLSQLPLEPEAEEFRFLGNVFHDGRQCRLVRTEPINSVPELFDEMTVDTSQRSLILRHVYFSGKNPWLRLDTTFRVERDDYVPSGWTLTWMVAGKTARVTRVTVEEVVFNPAVGGEGFDVVPGPGDVISSNAYPKAGIGLDPARPATTVTEVQSDGSVTQVSQSGFWTKEGIEVEASPSQLWWWVGGVGALSATVGVLFVIRRRKRLFRGGDDSV